MNIKGQRKLAAVGVALVALGWPLGLITNPVAADAMKVIYTVYSGAVVAVVGWFFNANSKEYKNDSPA